jgi:hypothetical protein
MPPETNVVRERGRILWMCGSMLLFLASLVVSMQTRCSLENSTAQTEKASVFLSTAAKQVARVWRCRLSRWQHPRWTRHDASMGVGGCVLFKEHVLRIYSDVQHRSVSLFSFGRRADERQLERAGERT